MWGSLQKIMTLPPETLIYCGHEYTMANAKFALSVEPENEALRQRATEVEQLRARSEPALPVKLLDELTTNPFLRPDSPDIQKRLGTTGRAYGEIFGKLRSMKDSFR